MHQHICAKSPTSPAPISWHLAPVSAQPRETGALPGTWATKTTIHERLSRDPPPPPTPESPPTQTMILLPLFIYTILLIHQRKLGLRLLMPLFFIIASSIINTINGILLGGLCQVAIVHWVLSPEKPLRVPNTSPNSNLKTRVPKEASSERIPYGSRVL